MIQLPVTNRPDVSFLIDDHDQSLITGYRWRLSTNGYIVSSIKQDKVWRLVYLHRLILGLAQGRQCDHINHNRLDNRRQNLRSVTPQQNLRNRGRFSRSQSGFTGVSQRGKRFQAYLRVDGRKQHLGSYDTAETAALVRDAYARHIDEKHFALNYPHRTISAETHAFMDALLHPGEPHPARPENPPQAHQSQYRGVYWERGQWRAKISTGGRDVHLGYFVLERDAASAYDAGS